jgi:putative transposase
VACAWCELERLTTERSLPRVVVSDNRTELTSGPVLRWSTGRLDWQYIEPGKAVQNAFVESFNSKLRDECLNEHVFLSWPRRARPSSSGD